MSTVGEFRDRVRDNRTTVPEMDAALNALAITVPAGSTEPQKRRLLMDFVKGKKRSDPAPYDFPILVVSQQAPQQIVQAAPVVIQPPTRVDPVGLRDRLQDNLLIGVIATAFAFAAIIGVIAAILWLATDPFDTFGDDGNGGIAVKEDGDNVKVKTDGDKANTKISQPSGSDSAVVPPFGDIEAMPRLSSSSAPLGAWYHPIWNDGMFKDSNGMNGQWNWTNTIVQLGQQGGNFIQGPDGELWFRHTAQTGTFSFAVKTTSKYKSAFMPKGIFPIQVSIDAFHTGAIVHVLDQNGRDLNGGAPIHLSEQGQTAITLPDDGITVITVTETDPAALFEFKARFGPDDRPAANHFDARNR